MARGPRSPWAASPRTPSIRLALSVALMPVLATQAGGALPAATHTVTNIADGGPGSLRQAIVDANASPGGDRIEFDIPDHLCSDPCVIRPGVALPPLTGGGIIIDGFSQSGAFRPAQAGTGVIRVVLDGSGVENQSGLTIVSAGNVVEGLAIHSFGWNGVAIAGPDARGNRIVGNHIGVSAHGVGRESRRANGFDGVFVGLGASGNTIGGDLFTERNVISGNGWAGVGIHGADTTGNHVAGNLIGLDAMGATAIRNSLDGVRIYGGAKDTAVGVVDDVGERNIIGGNARDGIRMAGAETAGLQAAGNLIGANIQGTATVPNDGDGIHIMAGAGDAEIGTAATPALGLIVGNRGHGVHIENSAGGVVIRNQFIGVSPTGARSWPNDDGVRIVNSPNVTVGGPGLEEVLVISGNRGVGVRLSGSGTTSGVLQVIRIGTTSTGASPLPNRGGGVLIEDGARDNLVGGTGGVGNLIAGNGGNGVAAMGDATLGNRFRMNEIHHNDGAGIRVGDGAHGGIDRPRLVSFDATSLRLAGEACAGCEVEIYSDEGDEGAQPIIVIAAAATGRFEITLPAPPEHQNLTAIATDPVLGSSEFSRPLPVAGPAATVTATASASPTATASASPTATASATPTATATATGAATATGTRAATATTSPTSSPTDSPSRTPEATPSPTDEVAFRVWLPRL